MEFEDEYHEPIDVEKFCDGLKMAWKNDPEMPFHVILEQIFIGYDLSQLAPDELQQLLDDFLLQNSI